MRKYSINRSSKSVHSNLVLVLHGASEGHESSFIKQICNHLTINGFDNMSFNFSYIIKGKAFDKDNVDLEVSELDLALKHAKKLGYKWVTIIGKSLGGIIATHWLKCNNGNEFVIKIIIFGFVKNEVSLKGLTRVNSSLIIQGENDRFGNGSTVKKELNPLMDRVDIVEIKGADHSYRNYLGEPEYEKNAISYMIDWLKLHDK